MHLIYGKPGVTEKDLDTSEAWGKELFASKMSGEKPTLAYWGGVRGNGSALRFQLAYSRVDYNMKEYTSPD